MPNQTIRVLRVDVPGNSLATWLAAHHPDLFLTVLKQAQAAQVAQKIQLRGLRGLADGTTTTFDSADAFSNPPLQQFDFSTPSLQQFDLSSPGLQTISFDSDALVPASFLTDSTDTGSSFLSNLGGGLTSAGSTLGSVFGGALSGTLGALGSVGSYLTSATGLNNLTGLAKTYFAAQGATATAATQQAVLQAQVSRAATGQTAAPITYQRDAYGNVVPVYATNTAQGNIYQPLSPQGIANLTPSSISVFVSRYGIWIGLAALAAVGFVALRNR